MANTCTPTEFKARFPEFSAVDDPRIQIFIDDALLVIKEPIWNSLYSLGVCYLAAHYLSLSEKSSAGNGGSVGNVASKGVDGVTISYNTANLTTIDQSYYFSTQYGQRFYSMIKSLGVMAATV